MATLAEMRSRFAEKVQDTNFTGISSASVDALLNDALRFYKYRTYWFNEAEIDIVLNVNDPVVPGIPAGLLEEKRNGGLVIQYSTMLYPLTKVSSLVYDTMNVSAQGLPEVYTFRNQQYELYYFPSAAYTLKLRYTKDYADFTDNSDSNDFSNYGDRMLMYDALSRFYGEYKQDTERQAYYAGRAEEEEDNMKRRSTALSGSGAVTIHSNLIT